MVAWIRRWQTGFPPADDDRDWMEQDPDLEILKTDPEFQQLLAQLKPQS